MGRRRRDGTYDDLVGELVWELHVGIRAQVRRLIQPSEERTHDRHDRKRAHCASTCSFSGVSTYDVSTLRRGCVAAGFYVPLHEARVLRGSGGGGRGVNAVCESLRGGAGE